MLPKPLAIALALLCAGASVAPGVAHAQERLPTPDAVTLQPGDLLRIQVWPDQTLNGEFRVEETGNVYLPFLGSVTVAGVTLDRLRAQLRAGYEEIIKEPVVTITPVFRVAVMGEVGRPGVYQIDPTHDILDVVLMAGGLRERAKGDEVQLVRPGQVIDLDVQRALEEGADLGGLRLQSGDRILVPRRGAGFQVRDFLSVVTTLTSTALLVERLINRN